MSSKKYGHGGTCVREVDGYVLNCRYHIHPIHSLLPPCIRVVYQSSFIPSWSLLLPRDIPSPPDESLISASQIDTSEPSQQAQNTERQVNQSQDKRVQINPRPIAHFCTLSKINRVRRRGDIKVSEGTEDRTCVPADQIGPDQNK